MSTYAFKTTTGGKAKFRVGSGQWQSAKPNCDVSWDGSTTVEFFSGSSLLSMKVGTDIITLDGTDWASGAEALQDKLIDLFRKANTGTGGSGSITTDAVPTSGSTSPVQSGGAYTADQALQTQITANTTNITKNTNRIQTETRAWLDNVTTASGYVSGSDIAAVDRVITRIKAAGITPKVLFMPVGDYVAAKIPFISPAAWTWNNFTSADYSVDNGFVVSTNSTKYVSTGFIPNSQGLTSKNFSFAIASTVQTAVNNFGVMVGNDNNSTEFFVSFPDVSTNIGGIGLKHGGFAEACRQVGYSDASNVRGWTNGTWQTSRASATLAQTSEITLFRGMSGIIRYATGGLGFFFIGPSLTNAQAFELDAAMFEFLQATKAIYRKPCSFELGDSIIAGQGLGSTLDYPYKRSGALTAKRYGVREQNHAQYFGKLMADESTEGAKALVNKYADLLQKPSAYVDITIGTNDMSADAQTNGDSTNATTFYNNMNLVAGDFVTYKHRVILCSPTYRNDGMTTTKQLLYHDKIRDVAILRKVPFISLYYAFLDYTGGTLASLFTGDGLHPSDIGNELMADYKIEALQGRIIRKPTLDFGSIAAQSVGSLTVTHPSAAVGMAVNVTPLGALEAGLGAPYGIVTALNTVTVYLPNLTGSAIDPAALQYKVTVFTNY